MQAGVVNLKLMADIMDLQNKMRQAESLVGGTAEKMGQAFLGLKSLVAGVFAGLSAGGLLAMVNDVKTAAVDIERMSAMAGSSPEEFQRMAVGAKSVGVDMSKFSDIMKDTQDKVGEFLLTGGGELEDFFKVIAPKVGVTAEQFRNLSGPQALQLFYTSLEKAGVGQKIMVQQMESIADEASVLAPLLANGGAGFQRLGDEAEKAGAIMDKDLRNASKALQAELGSMQMLLDGVANKISSAVMPELAALAKASREELAAGFEAVSAWVIDNKEQLLGAWNAAKSLGSEVWEIVKAVAAVAVGVSKWAVESGAVQVVLESAGLMVAGMQDGVKILGALFFDVGSVILKTILAPLRWYLEGLGKVQGFLGNTEWANTLSAAAAGIKGFADAGGNYASGVYAQFSRGESAVAKFSATVGRSTAATVATVAATKNAFDNLGSGKGIAKISEDAKKAAEAAAKLSASGKELADGLLAQDSGLSGDFAKKWDSLNAAYKSGAISLDILTSAQAALLAQQPAMKAAQDEAVKAAQASADARKKEADGIAEWMIAQTQAAAQSLATVRERITGLQDEEAALAISRTQNISLAEAVEMLAIARMQEAQSSKFFEGSEGWQALQREIDARKELLGLMSTKSVRDKEEAGWSEIWRSVDGTAHDAFVNIFQGGQDAFTKLRDTLKATLLDLLYQMTVKKWIFNIGASVTGAMGMSGAASAATSLGSGGGGLGGAMNIASQIKSVYSTITGGFAALGDSVAFAAQDMGAWLVQNTTGVLNSAGSSLMSSAGALGTAASYAGGALAGYGLGTAISGKYETFGNGNIATVAGTVLGSIFGGPIGGAIGGAIGGLVNRAFGRGPKETTAMGLSGTLSASTGASVQSYSSWKQDGGWFRSDRSGVDYSPVNAELGGFLGSAVAMTTAATKTYASAIGLSANAVSDYSQAIKISLQGLDEKAQEAAIGKALSGFADGMAGVYDGLQDLSADGEGASATLARLATSLTASNRMLGMLRQRLFEVSLYGADAASQLADVFGGLDAMGAAVQAYYEAYYTQAERTADSTAALAAALADVGVVMPKTKQGFRDVVAGLDLNTDAGRKAYAVLLALAPEFAATADQVSELAEATAKSLIEAFSGASIAAPSLGALSAAAGLLTEGLSDTQIKALALATGLTKAQIKAGLLNAGVAALDEGMGSISAIFLDSASAALKFGDAGDDLAPAFTGAELASILLHDEIDTLRASAGAAVIDVAGLSAALESVNTETFVATVSKVFESLAERVSALIGDIGAERVAVREAALRIVEPAVMSKAAIVRGIGSVSTTLPSNDALSLAQKGLVAADTLVSARESAQAKALSDYQAVQAATAKASASAAGQLSSAQSSLTRLYNGYADIRRLTAYDVSKLLDGSIAAGTVVPEKFGVAADLTEELRKRLEAQSSARDLIESTAASNATSLAAAQEKYKDAVAATTTAQSAADKAAEVARKAQLEYAAALQDFAIDAGKSVSKLSRLREETVKYYDAQKQLADMMSASASGLRSTVADYRYSQLTEAQQFSKLQTDYATAYSMGLSTSGETLAGYGDKLNGMLNPLLEKARDVLSDDAYKTFADTAIARAEAIAERLDTLTPKDYAADSLAMLEQIDSTLAALDASSKSAEKVIADAVTAGSEKTAEGLRAVIAALTGEAVPAFATGAAFGAGGVVSRPTMFDMGLMGEAGDEAIMPLANIGGKLGVRAVGGRSSSMDTARLEALVERLTAEVASLRIEARATAANTGKIARQGDRAEVEGVLVRTDADAPLAVEAL